MYLSSSALTTSPDLTLNTGQVNGRCHHVPPVSVSTVLVVIAAAAASSTIKEFLAQLL